MRTKPPIRIDGDIAYVPLSRGYEAIIDASDVPIVEKFSWHVLPSRKTMYAKTHERLSDGRDTMLTMHRLILNRPMNMQVDHINGEGLDNRRCNLRLASNTQNQWNQRVRSNSLSGMKGVGLHKETGKWRAYIKVNCRLIHLGTFDNLNDAASAYAAASAKYHGEFGRVA